MYARSSDIFSRVLHRYSRLQLLLVLLIIVTLFVSFGAYSNSDAGGSWKHAPATNQAHVGDQIGRTHLHDTYHKDDTTNDEAIEPEKIEDDDAKTSAKLGSANGITRFTNSSNITTTKSPTSSKSFVTVNGLIVKPPPPPADEEEYLAICMLVKEVPLELREFLTHHYYHHGIRRFYIYDDGSSPPMAEHPGIDDYNVPKEVLSFNYIDSESVDPDERETFQDQIMDRCIQDHGAKHKWMALLDPDEYLEMRHNQFPILLDWLRHWEKKDNVGALAVQWLPHNSADLIEIPNTDFRKSYTRCVSGDGPDDYHLFHVKSFVRPQFVNSIPNIHAVYFNQEEMMRYGEHMDDATSVTREPATHEFWALHHYGTGSKKYFERKQGKGRSQGPDKWPVDQDYWDRYHDGVTSYECNEMVKFEP